MKAAATLALLFLLTSLHAQDTIYRRDGVRIIAKVLEIGPKEIRYKTYGNPDGPLYVVDKGEISRIAYPNGTSDDIRHEMKRAYVKRDSLKNALYINASDLLFAMVTMGYEREISDHFTTDVSLSSGINAWRWNMRYNSNDDLLYYSSRKAFSGVVSLNIFPRGQQKDYNFFIGPRLEAGAYYYRGYPFFYYYPIQPNYGTSWYSGGGLQMGVKIRPTDRLNIILKGAMGMQYKQGTADGYPYHSSEFRPLGRIAVEAGWRF